MLGLDEYGSSDEEQSSKVDQVSRQRVSTLPDDDIQLGSRPREHDRATQNVVTDNNAEESHVQVVTVSRQEDDGQMVGPLLGPTRPSNSPRPTNGSTSQPQSPYTLNRLLIRDLTLPPVPNLEIPPSPPGSPPPSSTTAKFTHFLELKKQGVHFNEKLSRSSALKNPSLFEKLTRFAGIDEQDQYASALPKDVWDHPNSFPSWAYKEELAKSQQEILKRKEEDKMRAQREALDFVPASTTSGDSGRATPSAAAGAGGRSMGRSAAERVMAGLDREKTRSPYGSDGDKRRAIERRGGRYDGGYKSRDRSRSPGRRRRSRSR